MFEPDHDGFVVSSEPYLRFGDLDSLRVGDGAKQTRSALKFTVTGLASAPAKATLRVFAFDGGPEGGAVYLSSNYYAAQSAPWTEDGLKWATQPELLGAPLATLGPVTGGSWAEYNVTAAIAGDGTYSFTILATGTDALGFHSRESNFARPELVIVP